MKNTLLLVLLIVSLPIFCQDYFQQEVNSTIHVRLDDENHRLQAKIRMEYINHSDSVLEEMYIHLWPNAYANDETALAQQLLNMEMTDFYFSNAVDRGNIKGIAFTIDGVHHDYQSHCSHIDIARISLQKPLLPGDTIIIETPFEVKVPSSAFSRLGHNDNSYQITQWFPKPAVFDREGWHPMPYLSVGEFYSEFGDYDVYITVPLKYKVAATGNLHNEVEREWLMDLHNEGENHPHPYASDSTFKTLHYSIEHVHDFAWFADPDYRVKNKVMELPNGHKVQCWAYYLPRNEGVWNEALTYLERSTRFYSEHIGTYPYNTVCAVDGALAAGGGMEYPTITVIGETEDPKGFEEVLMHEVGHNWFYGMLAFNERANPWLDEGLNSYYQYLYMLHHYPDDKLLHRIFSPAVPDNMFGQGAFPSGYQNALAHNFMAAIGLDQAMNTHSEDFGMYSYFIGVYMKPTVYFNHLREYLGHAEWDRIIKGFFDEWAGKHPLESDFINHLEAHATKDITWFTKELLSSTGQMDYKISAVKRSENGFRVTVRNSGKVNTPVLVSGIDASGRVIESHWIDSVGRKSRVDFNTDKIVRFALNEGFMTADVNPHNDDSKSTGFIKRWNNPLPKFLFYLPQQDRISSYWFPIVGWNSNDRYMFGLSLYNNWALAKRFQFRLQPMYSFHSGELTGMGEMYYNLFPNGRIQRVAFGLKASRYSSSWGKEFSNDKLMDVSLPYNVIKPSVSIYLRNHPAKRKLQNRLSLAYNLIGRTAVDYTDRARPKTKLNRLDLYRLSYLYDHARTVNPYRFAFNAETNLERWKVGAEFAYFVTYNQKNRGLALRVFGGKLLGDGNLGYSEGFRLSGWRGKEDFLYDHLMLNRFDGVGNGLWSQQMMMNDGGFAVPSFMYANDWIVGLNVSTSTFLPAFIRVYGNFAMMPDFNNDLQNYYEAGLCLSFWKKALEVYFPVLWSESIKERNELNKVKFYEQNIRFTIDFNRINPFDYLRHVKF